MPTKDSFKVLTGKAAENITIKDARWFAAFTTAVAVVGTSILTRYRASNGQQPMLKVLF